MRSKTKASRVLRTLPMEVKAITLRVIGWFVPCAAAQEILPVELSHPTGRGRRQLPSAFFIASATNKRSRMKCTNGLPSELPIASTFAGGGSSFELRDFCSRHQQLSLSNHRQSTNTATSLVLAAPRRPSRRSLSLVRGPILPPSIGDPR
jgi:hypothetical protein